MFRKTALDKIHPKTLKITTCPNCNTKIKKGLKKLELKSEFESYECENCNYSFSFPFQGVAKKTFIRSSPRKMRLITDLVRGKYVDDALTILRFQTKHAARDCENLLKSAIANVDKKDENRAIDKDSLFIKEIFVDQGPTMKRISAAPMGRAYRIKKRSNHLTIVVAPK